MNSEIPKERIHTALLGIAKDGADEIPLGEGLALVRPNTELLSRRYDWAQSKAEMEQEAGASRYLVCEYPLLVEGEAPGTSLERGENRFYSGLMAIQVIKPIPTLGFIYKNREGRHIEARPPMEPGRWAGMNMFDDAMMARVPGMIERIHPVMTGENVAHKNALSLLQLGLEHFHPYIAGLLWVMGLEAILDSRGRNNFEKKLCECLGEKTLAFPNWHSRSEAPTWTVEEIAIPLYMLRNKLAHGQDLRKAEFDKSTPVDLTAEVQLTPSSEPVTRALYLSQAALHLLCQVLQKELPAPAGHSHGDQRASVSTDSAPHEE